ncbi:MAG: hypothetical protein R3B91_04965 [Planctomycetaceae bacterium]
MVVREFDERIGMTASFAAMLDDPRHDPTHAMLAMVRQRCTAFPRVTKTRTIMTRCGMIRSSNSRLRSTPEDGAELASQPTLSRFENAISVKALLRLRELVRRAVHRIVR